MMNYKKFTKILMTIAVLMHVHCVKSVQPEEAKMVVPKGKQITSMTLMYGDKGKDSVDKIDIPASGLKNINKNLTKGNTLYSQISHDQPNYLEYSVSDSTGKPVHHGISDIYSNEPGVTNWEFTKTHSRFAGHYFKYQLDKQRKVYSSPFAKKGHMLRIVQGK